ncbi:MAG TPA: hypothetical protein VGS27_10000 [Candidatus Sulfotelmatobacter sp.]|nr:hypothetical protein [Candidatus Sulfotelmatobacter sp.]
MHQIHWALVFFLTCSLPLCAQTPQQEPQSARQALIEMFWAKGGEPFIKHLPEEARKMLIRKGETGDASIVLRVASVGGTSSPLGEHVETFATGPNLLISEQPSQHERIEVAVEHDSWMGDADEIELSVHVYKNGQEQPLSVIPRLIFTLRQEKEIWRLTEINVVARVPFTDSDYLKGLRKQQDDADESAAKVRMLFIPQAENRYAANHPDRGFSCSLSELYAPPTGEEALSYVPPFGNEESNGYRFLLSGCEGTPATKYQLIAVPLEVDSDLRTFCTDQSGTVKSITGAKASRCLSRGKPLNQDTAAAED